MADLPKVIYVMGPPGAGKGTQAEMLADAIGYHRFSTGGAFRALSRQDSELGRKVKNLIDNGFLAPAELAAEVLTAAVKEHMEVSKGLLFEGSPRTVKEAAIIDEFFAKQGYGRPLVIRLMVDKDDMIARNSKRVFCLGLDNDFPVVTEVDRKRCDELGGHVGKRPDEEDSEKLETRWKEFEENTLPVIQKYEKEGIVHHVDGKKSIPEVHQEVMGVIEAIRQT